MKALALTITALLVTGGAAIAAPPRQKAASAKKSPVPAVAKPAPAPKPVSPPPMWAVAYAPDGAHLAVGTYRRVLVFDAVTGAKTGDYAVSRQAVRALAYSPDGKEIAAGTGVPGESGSAVVIDALTGKSLRTVEGHDDTVEAVAFENDDLLLTAANDEKVRLTSVASGKTVGTLSEHIGRCLSVAVPTKTDEAHGGDIFATGGADKAVKIWDAKARRVVVNFDQAEGAVWCLAASPRAGSFIAGSDDGKVRLLGVRMADGARSKAGADGEPAQRTGFVERTINAHTGAVYAVAASGDGNFVVSGGADSKVIEWNAGGGKKREWTEAKRDIWGVAVSPDSKRIAAASLDGRVRVYDAASGALIFTLDTNGVVTAPVAPPAATLTQK